MSSGFALRVAVLGGIALVMFAVIFFRLWYLQVLSGDKYLAEANNNRIREVRVPGAARRDPRPKRRGPGREPHQPGAAAQARRSCPADSARAARRAGAPRPASGHVAASHPP